MYSGKIVAPVSLGFRRVHNLEKHKICASPITLNVGPLFWLDMDSSET